MATVESIEKLLIILEKNIDNKGCGKAVEAYREALEMLKEVDKKIDEATRLLHNEL